MKLSLYIVLLFALAGTAQGQTPVGYSGRLVEEDGSPLKGPVDLRLTFHDAKEDGNQIGEHHDFSAVALTSGVFQVELTISAADLEDLQNADTVFVQIKDLKAGKTYPRQLLPTAPRAFLAARIPVNGTSLVFDDDGNLTIDVEELDLAAVDFTDVDLGTAENTALHLKDDDGSANKVTLAAPPDVATDIQITLPEVVVDGNYLQTDTDGKTAWTAPAGTGEINTASNQGAAGVGVFDSKSGLDLRFKNVAPGSNKVKVTLDAPNREIDLDIDETALDMAQMGGSLPLAGDLSGTHGASTVVGIQGRTVENATPSAGETLVWSNANGQWEPAVIPGAGQSNTASNQGAAGVGLFEGKTGADLGFRNVNAGSTKISITPDVPSKEIDIDVDEAALDLANFQGSLTLAGDVTGAHGAATVAKIQGRDVVATLPTDGDALSWNNAFTRWEPVTLPDPGEANTGSNQGTAGVGVLDAMNSGDLQFRNVNNTAAGRLTVNLDATNHEIDIDVNEAALDLAALNGPLTIQGDVTGSHGANTVARLQGKAIDTAAPTDGQVLTWNNGDSAWKPVTPATVGEVNTASNEGAAGVGVFDGKTGANLGFRNLNDAGSGRISVVHDSTSHEVDLDIDESNLDIDNLSGDLALSGDVSGNHGALTVQKIQGRDVDSGLPGDGEVLTWNATSSKWEAKVPTAFGEVNSGVNLGSGGVGVFDGKSLADLQFRNLNDAGGGRLSVTLDGANKEIDIDVNQSALDLANLGGSLTMGGDISGAHGTIKVEQIQGRPVATYPPTDGQALTWSQGNSQWEPATTPVGEVNTASNQGTAGVGFVDGKLGVDLEFRNVNDAGGGRIDVALDDPNNEIDLDVEEANLDLGAFGGSLTLAGDLTGSHGSTVVSGLQGRVLDAAAPTDSQVLTWDDGNSRWEPMTPADPGEVNTASNQGAGGEGPFLSKNGSTLEFGNIAAASGRIAVTLDPANDEVDLDVVQGSLSLGNLGGTLTLAGDVTGDHDGATVARIQGRDVEDAQPGASQVLKWNGTTSTWELGTDEFGSVGEFNTASNQGAGGVGPFLAKTNADLEFRNVNAASARISVAPDAANAEVDLDVAEASLNIDAIGGTLSLAGDVTGTHDAVKVEKIQGMAVLDQAPGPGQVMKWDSGDNRWEPAADIDTASPAYGDQGAAPSGTVYASDEGRLGIGTFAPAARLEIQGDLSAALSGTVTVGAGTPNVTGSGTSFQSELHVGDAISIAGEIHTVAAIGSNTALTLATAHAAGASAVTAYKDAALLRLASGDGDSRLVIDQSGRLGLGASPASAALHVKSREDSTPVRIRGVAAHSASLQEWQSSTAVPLAFVNATGRINMKDADGAAHYLTLTPASNMTSSVTYTWPSAPVAGGLLSTNGAGDFSWTPEVGDIAGVSAGTGLSGGGTSGTPSLTVDVGTTASKIVQLDGSAKLPALDGSQLQNVNASGSPRVADTNGDTQVQAEESADEDTLRFDTAAAERLVIDDNGNVGIGAASTGARLEVTGGAVKATGGFILETRTSDPGSPEPAQMWLRTDL